MAEACVFLMRLPEDKFAPLVAAGRAPLVNVGAGRDLAIAELAALVAEVVGWRGRFEYDAAKPDGTPRKLLDTSLLAGLGWRPRVGLREGIALAYRDFLRRHAAAA
jgi:GDP-L-fucose synthase